MSLLTETMIEYVNFRQTSSDKFTSKTAQVPYKNTVSRIPQVMYSKRTNKSYLVNMRRIKKYQCNEAELDNGQILRVSEKNYAENKKRYLLWKGRK